MTELKCCSHLFVMLSVFVIHEFTFFVDFNCQRALEGGERLEAQRALSELSAQVYSFLIAFSSLCDRCSWMYADEERKRQHKKRLLFLIPKPWALLWWLLTIPTNSPRCSSVPLFAFGKATEKTEKRRLWRALEWKRKKEWDLIKFMGIANIQKCHWQTSLSFFEILKAFIHL